MSGEIVFSPDQLEAIDMIRVGESIFLTGSAGCGKSLILKSLHKIFPDKNIQLTSSTGISAFNISAMTIFSFLNLGIGGKSLRSILKYISNERKQVIMDLDILVIDEISMISAEIFYEIDMVLKYIRNNTSPFGGVQLVLSGDFLQLENISGTIILDSFLWKQNIIVVKLTTNFRQSSNQDFVDLLTRLRVNQLTDEDIQMLNSRVFPGAIKTLCGNSDTVNPPMILYPTNAQVNAYNRYKYSELVGEEFSYEAKFNGNKSISNDLKGQFMSKEMVRLKFKKHARVMLIRNLDTASGFVNGAVGEIVDFENGLPVVLFDHTPTLVTISPSVWENMVGVDRGTAEQIPLILSYSSTQHKVQGLTLPNAIIDIGNTFTNHQVYTSISRVQTLAGLYLLSFDPKKIKTNQRVIDFYSSI